MTHGDRISHHARGTSLVCACLIATCALMACRGAPEKIREGAVGPVGLPPDSLLASVALGDVAGGVGNALTTQIKNPYYGNTAAIESGRQIFVQMNCVACHGYDAKGGMGPNLTDTYWRYGGSPAEIYKSVYEGRPQGMPAWGRMIPHDAMWKVVAYIQSLGGAYPAKYAQAGREGDLGDKDTTAGSTLKGRQNDQ